MLKSISKIVNNFNKEINVGFTSPFSMRRICFSSLFNSNASLVRENPLAIRWVAMILPSSVRTICCDLFRTTNILEKKLSLFGHLCPDLFYICKMNAN